MTGRVTGRVLAAAALGLLVGCGSGASSVVSAPASLPPAPHVPTSPAPTSPAPTTTAPTSPAPTTTAPTTTAPTSAVAPSPAAPTSATPSATPSTRSPSAEPSPPTKAPPIVPAAPGETGSRGERLYARGETARSYTGATLTCTARSSARGRTTVSFTARGYQGKALAQSSFTLTDVDLTRALDPSDTSADVVDGVVSLDLTFPTADAARWPLVSFDPAPTAEEAFAFRCTA